MEFNGYITSNSSIVMKDKREYACGLFYNTIPGFALKNKGKP